MAWRKITAVGIALKGKYVRFVQPYNAPNLSHAFGTNNANQATVRIAAAAVGKIYEVRGGTMFIGFSNDLKTPPPAHMGPTSFGATIQLYIDDMGKIEVDM